MNGNIVFLAFAVATHGILPLASLLAGTALPYALVLMCFAAGAVADGRLARRDGQTGRRIGFASDAGLIGVAAVAVALTHPRPAGQARYLVIGILAVAMGMQNVLIRRWGIPDLATNAIVTNAMTKTVERVTRSTATVRNPGVRGEVRLWPADIPERSSRIGLAWKNEAWLEGCPQVKRSLSTRSGGCRSGSGPCCCRGLSGSMICKVRSWSSASRARSFFALSNRGWYSASSAGVSRRVMVLPAILRVHSA
jgi:hypothetical protein